MAAAPPPHLDYGLLNMLGGHLFRHAFRMGQEAFADVFADQAITPLQFMVLELVSRNPGVTHKEICAAMGAAPSVITTTLKPLIADRVLLQRRTTDDGRSVGYVLSKKGTAWFGHIRPKIHTAETKLFKGLTSTQRDSMIDTLRHLTRRATTR